MYYVYLPREQILLKACAFFSCIKLYITVQCFDILIDVAILQSIMDEDFEEPKPLTPTQKAKIERSRQKALLLKQARLANQPYTKTKSER